MTLSPESDSQARGVVRQSTREFFAAWKKLEEPSWGNFIHGYIYMRWPYLYISLGTGEHRLSGVLKGIGNIIKTIQPDRVNENEPPPTFAEGYHGKVVPTKSASQLISIKEDVDIRNIETVIPYEKARDIIMMQPDHIVALECPCRAARENPCTPLDVCIIVGEPFSSLVMEHHPGKARWVSQEEAEAILIAEHERGHVHHAFFKDAMLDRFYAICNCCSCCCGAMQSFRSGTPMLESSGYVSTLDPVLCGGCGECVEVCPFNAIEMDGSTARVSLEQCMGCGICVSNCSFNALRLERSELKSEPLELYELIEEYSARAAFESSAVE